jgi:hypothetical protein
MIKSIPKRMFQSTNMLHQSRTDWRGRTADFERPLGDTHSAYEDGDISVDGSVFVILIGDGSRTRCIAWPWRQPVSEVRRAAASVRLGLKVDTRDGTAGGRTCSGLGGTLTASLIGAIDGAVAVTASASSTFKRTTSASAASSCAQRIIARVRQR